MKTPPVSFGWRGFLLAINRTALPLVRVFLCLEVTTAGVVWAGGTIIIRRSLVCIWNIGTFFILSPVNRFIIIFITIGKAIPRLVAFTCLFLFFHGSWGRLCRNSGPAQWWGQLRLPIWLQIVRTPLLHYLAFSYTHLKSQSVQPVYRAHSFRVRKLIKLGFFRKRSGRDGEIRTRDLLTPSQF